MLRNYLLVSFRNLRRAPLNSIITVAGFAVSLACSAFILAYIVDELSYERFHENGHRIVRIGEDQTKGNADTRLATSYGPLAPALKQDLAVVEEAVRFQPYGLQVSVESVGGGAVYQENRFTFVDSTFLEVFSFELLRGDPSRVLDAPFSVVITRSTAQRYFGDIDPIGRTIRARDDDEIIHEFTITGVVEDPPHRTHLQFTALASFASLRAIYGSWIDDPRNWEHPPLYTYALMQPGVTPDELQVRLDPFAERRMGPDRTRTRRLVAEPLFGIRLHQQREHDVVPSSDAVYLYVFGAIGLLILLVAGINFVNLATARLGARTREIGIRKAVGARRNQIAGQFLGETLLTVGAAAVVALGLVVVLFPWFREISGTELQPDALGSGWIVAGFLAVCGLFGVGAGLYPAVRLAGLDASRSLRARTYIAAGPPRLRQALLTVQFAVSIGMLIITGAVIRQVDYIRNDRLGFAKEHVVIVPLRDMASQMDSDALTSEWERLPGVRHATASSGMPGLGEGLHDFWLRAEGAASDSILMKVLTVDPDYVETYGLEIVMGRDFSSERAADADDAFLINESSARRLGWNDPIGKQLTMRYYHNGEKTKRGRVVGIVRDFQYGSLRRAIEPIVFHILPGSYYLDYASARVDPNEVSETLSAMKDVWNHFAPGRAFEYRFLDEQFDALYRSEERLGRLFGTFAMLAVITACLGLFGLSGQVVAQRTKEIGIRKVLGAGVATIFVLVTKEFARAVLFGFLIATPVCIVVLRGWLESFAERIQLSADLFVAVLVITLLLTFITVGYHARRSAIVNPVESLRYE